jgi:glutamate-1-semialdehyde aminotransferase
MKLVKKPEEDKKVKDGKQTKDQYRMDCMEKSIAKMEKVVDDMKRHISRMRSNLDAHINRQFTEIRVIEENGKWGDYSGTFYLDSDDEKKMVLDKAKKHFETYFKDGVYHRNKKLGLFLSSPRAGKQLIEEIKTEE